MAFSSQPTRVPGIFLRDSRRAAEQAKTRQLIFSSPSPLSSQAWRQAPWRPPLTARHNAFFFCRPAFLD